jgi:hypothetical protein
LEADYAVEGRGWPAATEEYRYEAAREADDAGFDKGPILRSSISAEKF